MALESCGVTSCKGRQTGAGLEWHPQQLAALFSLSHTMLDESSDNSELPDWQTRLADKQLLVYAAAMSGIIC